MTAKQYPDAKKRWREKNKEKDRHNNYRSCTRKFLREMATLEEIKEMEEIIENRKKGLSSTQVDDIL